MESYHCTKVHMWSYIFLKNINYYKKWDVELGLPSIDILEILKSLHCDFAMNILPRVFQPN